MAKRQSDSVNRDSRNKKVEDVVNPGERSPYDPAFPHDASFPQNVYPSEENRRKWSDEVDASRKAAEDGKEVKPRPKMGGGEY